MADEVLTQADIDKAVADAIAKQKAADAAETNVTVGHYQIDKRWLKWIISAVLLLAYANGWLDKDTVTTLITTVPMSKAPEVKEPEPPRKTAEQMESELQKPPPPVEVVQAPSITPDQIKQWADMLGPIFQKYVVDPIIESNKRTDPKPLPPKPDPEPEPLPDPTPKPQPKPDPAPTDGIKAVDADGKFILMDVESGHQFKVVAGQPGLWGYEPKSTFIDVQQYPDHAIVTLRDDPSSPVATEITLAHSTATALSMLRVRCQHAAQPPPDDVKPKPQPTPTQKLSAIQLVYPPNASPVVAKAIGNQPWWDLTYPNAWSFYTSNTANTQARRAIATGAAKGISPPLLALWTGPDTLANVIPLPMTLDELPGRVQEALK